MEIKREIKKIVTQNQLSIMLVFILDKYSDIKDNYVELASKVSLEFNVSCFPQQIEQYYANILCGEDYELEERRMSYGYRV